MKWFVSRQSYWGEEDPLVVEIASGGLDYANADMLSDPEGIYVKLGCDQEYTDPREALRVAFRVRRRWKRWNEEHGITYHAVPRIEHGHTGGYTMPFVEEPSPWDLRQWANDAWEKLEKCGTCGDPIDEDGFWFLFGDPDLGKFCSQYCCDEYESQWYREIEELEDEES